jgi:hypothetical protein
LGATPGLARGQRQRRPVDARRQQAAMDVRRQRAVAAVVGREKRSKLIP